MEREAHHVMTVTAPRAAAAARVKTASWLMSHETAENTSAGKEMSRFALRTRTIMRMCASPSDVMTRTAGHTRVDREHRRWDSHPRTAHSTHASA